MLKALASEDMESALQLAKEQDPKKARTVGRRVSNLPTSWNERRFEAMVLCWVCRLKADRRRLKYMADTGATGCVYASERDKFWGSGLAFNGWRTGSKQ